MAESSAPALLLAARAKLLGSAAFQTAYADHKVGFYGTPSQAAVMIGSDKEGQPFFLDTADNEASISIWLGGREWTNSATSARFPRLLFSVWASGDVDTGTGEWLARDIAELVISVFDDPAGEQDKQWSADVYAVSCHYSRDLLCTVTEALDGTFRADLSFELEIA